MGLRHLLPVLTIAASCHGAALPDAGAFDLDTALDIFQEVVANPDAFMEALGVREKRHAETEDHSGFKEYNLPFLGVSAGVKYKDAGNRKAGGEAFVHVEDLQSLIPAAHSKMVKVHVNFDGGSSTTDGLFTAIVDYHLEHKDGDGTEEGSLKVVREKKGGKWHTTITTESHPFSGVTIIPGMISNLDLNLESDYSTMLKVNYQNPTKGRDIQVDVARNPGKDITATVTNQGAMTHTIKGKLTKPSAKETEVEIIASDGHTPYNVKISHLKEGRKGDKILVDVMKGSKKLLQLKLDFQVKGSGSGMKFRFKGDYSIMGGLTRGNVKGDYKDNVFNFEAGPYKLQVELHLGRSIKIEAFTNGVSMWTYETLRENKSTPAAFIYNLKSEMDLNPDSKLHHAISKYYPFGGFLKRTNTIKIFVDRINKNVLFNKFKVDFEVVKDNNNKVVALIADTTSSPYKFEFNAPRFFRKIGSSLPGVSLTIDHQKGKSLVIDSNIQGGLHLDINHKPNSQGGRSINVMATKAGAHMFKYHGETSKVNNAAMLKVGLKGQFDLSPESILYRTIVGKYRILTPFARRNSDFEFFWDKQNKNFLINKFYAKGKVDKDGTNVFNFELNTNKTPYKLYLHLPAVLGKLRPGMTEVDVDVDHKPGQSLEMKVNHAGTKFKGFKIRKTGNGDERELEWNGKKLAKGDYTITDKRFQMTQSMGGKSLTTTINWKNDCDSPNFLLDNKVNIKLAGTERNLDLAMDWGMDKVPDLDLSTAENGHMKVRATGNNPRWGDYSISRDIALASAQGKISVDLVGDSSFELGALAARSPIHTSIKASFDVNKTDLEGKFMKVLAGKEYSIEFPKGSFVMPTIKLGA